MRSFEMGAKKGQSLLQPDGPLVSVSEEERKQLRARRLKLELRQEDVAERAGCSTGTISNLESGRSTQVRRKVYARIRRVLRGKAVTPVMDEADEAMFRELVDGMIDLEGRDLRTVAALVNSLKKPR
jgi:transcriptional regulator with XRE-family HTH domain